MGSTLRWDLGEKDGKVGMGLGAGFVATGVEHQQDDGEQADRRAHGQALQLRGQAHQRALFSPEPLTCV